MKMEFALMLPGTSLCDVDGDTASGHWYMQELTRDLEGIAMVAVSRYQDSYCKQGGEWLYQSRQLDFIYQGPPDLSGNFTRPG